MGGEGGEAMDELKKASAAREAAMASAAEQNVRQLADLRTKLEGWPEMLPFTIPASTIRTMVERLKDYVEAAQALDAITDLLNDPDEYTVERMVFEIAKIIESTGRTIDFGASRDEWIKRHSETT